MGLAPRLAPGQQQHRTPALSTSLLWDGMGWDAVSSSLPCPRAGTHQVQLADLLLALDIGLVVCKDFKPVATKKGEVEQEK